MDKSWEAGVSPRKRIAMGDKDPLAVGDYGVDHLDSHAAGNKPYNKGNKLLLDHERAASAPINRNQANPDHGPHGNRE